MTLTEIAARLRMASAEMNALAALTEDTDWPDEIVPAFILNLTRICSRMSPVSWGDIFTLLFMCDKIMELRQAASKVFKK